MIPDNVHFLDEKFEIELCSSLSTLIIGSGMLVLHPYNFYHTENIKYVFVKAVNPPQVYFPNQPVSFIHNPLKYSEASLVSIKVPAESVEAYKTAPYWSVYADIISAIEE